MEPVETGADAMVIVAALVSRVEALVTASMLEAAGILVHVGGAAHAGVEINSLALGGHRLWIPASQHAEASAILLEVLGEDEWSFSYGLRRAVLRLMAFCAVFFSPMYLIGFWLGAITLPETMLWPLSAFAFPANPQGRGDYFLRGEDGRTYCA